MGRDSRLSICDLLPLLKHTKRPSVCTASRNEEIIANGWQADYGDRLLCSDEQRFANCLTSIVLSRGQPFALYCRPIWSRINVCVHNDLQCTPHARLINRLNWCSLLVVNCDTARTGSDFYFLQSRELHSPDECSFVCVCEWVSIFSFQAIYTITGISGYALACASTEFFGKS